MILYILRGSQVSAAAFKYFIANNIHITNGCLI